MIALDTNVFVRLLVADDDPIQHRRARACTDEAAASGGAYVGPLVLAETYWLLRSKFNLPRDQIVAALRSALRYRGLVFAHSDHLPELFDAVLDGTDLADGLIALDAADRKASPVLTFDRLAVREVAGMEFVP